MTTQIFRGQYCETALVNHSVLEHLQLLKVLGSANISQQVYNAIVKARVKISD